MNTQFDGATFEPEHDQARLESQLARVFDAMKCGQWMTLAEISQAANAPQASISARLRDFRKEKFGGHTVARRARGDRRRGEFEYRLYVTFKPQDLFA